MPNSILQYRDNDLLRMIPLDALSTARVPVEELSLKEGEIVFREGDPPDFCYLVRSGAVRITKALSHGRQELLSVISAGEFFGELSLYDSAPRSATATAAVTTQLGRISQETFEALRRAAPLEFAATLADVSIERVRRTNERLVQELVVAGRLSEVGADLGTLAHNLRSPLDTIRNAAEVVGGWLESPTHNIEETRKFVGIIHRTSNRALDQIEQIMARIRGELNAEFTRVPVAKVLGELKEQIQGHIRPGVRYNEAITYTGDVEVDPQSWVAALANLIKNSIEALPAEGGDVVVAVDEESGEVVFRVTDTGCGIEREKLPRFFDSLITNKAKGTGLGTAHARAVAERHGGRASVASEVGTGTTVELRIPLPQA